MDIYSTRAQLAAIDLMPREYTFLHDTEGTIHLTVSALDASGNELYKREFDVPMQQNHITWLSGTFFEGSGSSSTTTITGVTVNTDWAGETHLTF